MGEKEKKHSIKWLEKLKNIKHIEIYVAIIFIVILLLVYFGKFTPKEKTNNTTTNELSVTAYVSNIESNLEDILSNIAGVSNVKVMITLDITQMEVVDSQINMTSFPAIKGVLVTAKGVNNTTTRLKVLHAVEAVIDVTNGNVEILSSE